MNNQWLVTGSRGTDMAAKTLALPLQIAFQSVVVKTGFPNGDDPRVCRQSDQLRLVRIGALCRIRMDTYGSNQAGMGFRQGQYGSMALQGYPGYQGSFNAV
jgi:hypothetical protein